MSPNKLFDYLDGKLPARQREELERQIAASPVLQRELAMARKLHDGTHELSEQIEPPSPEAERGAILARRVALAFIVLVFLNVLIGLWFIFQHEKKKPVAVNAAEAGFRQQVERSVEKAGTAALPLPNLETDEIKIAAPTSEHEAITGKVIAAAVSVGGSGAKALTEETGIVVLVDIPRSRETDFRNQLIPLGAHLPPIDDSTKSATADAKKFLQIRIVPKMEEKKP
jgi:anti-sigma factor RsiW